METPPPTQAAPSSVSFWCSSKDHREFLIMFFHLGKKEKQNKTLFPHPKPMPEYASKDWPLHTTWKYVEFLFKGNIPPAEHTLSLHFSLLLSWIEVWDLHRSFTPSHPRKTQFLGAEDHRQLQLHRGCCSWEGKSSQISRQGVKSSWNHSISSKIEVGVYRGSASLGKVIGEGARLLFALFYSCANPAKYGIDPEWKKPRLQIQGRVYFGKCSFYLWRISALFSVSSFIAKSLPEIEQSFQKEAILVVFRPNFNFTWHRWELQGLLTRPNSEDSSHFGWLYMVTSAKINQKLRKYWFFLNCN